MVIVMIDTPGLDDEGELGTLRIQKSYQILNKTDIAILVVDACVGMTKEDTDILKRIKDKNIPYLIVLNKMDKINGSIENTQIPPEHLLAVSADTGENIHELKEKIASSYRPKITDEELWGT